MWSTRCSGQFHALADSSHRIRVASALPPAVCSVAGLHRPSAPWTRLPPSRLVPHPLRARPHPAGALPRLQANVLPPDVFDPLLHETVVASGSGGRGTDRLLGPPSNRSLDTPVEDLGNTNGPAIGPPRHPLSFPGTRVRASHPGAGGPRSFRDVHRPPGPRVGRRDRGGRPVVVHLRRRPRSAPRQRPPAGSTGQGA